MRSVNHGTRRIKSWIGVNWKQFSWVKPRIKEGQLAESWKSRKVLVTGGAGLIGSHLVEHLSRRRIGASGG